MGLLNRLFGRKTKRDAAPAPPRIVRAKYDAAQTTDGNRKHWAQADGLSASAANSPAVRRVLRNRARYEVANNSIFKGIVATFANDVVGPYPTLQLTDPGEGEGDVAVAEKVELAFEDWLRARRIPEKLRLMSATKIGSDGEPFALFIKNPNGADAVELDIEVVEADRFTTPTPFVPTPGFVDGIEFDAVGNPEWYHLLAYHPGDTFQTSGVNEYRRVHASEVIHWFRSDRPGQRRGIPEIMPGLPLGAMLRRYSLAVLDAAETAANHAAVLETDAPPNTEPNDDDAWQAFDIDRNQYTALPGGYKLSQLKAEQPTTTFVDFKREITNEFARCVQVPSNVATGDSSRYNYASGRLDHQTYDRAIDIERESLIAAVLDRIFAQWFAEARLIPGYLPDGARLATFSTRHTWYFKGREHVDPAKEATADEIKLRNNTTTLSEIWARKGRDWRKAANQTARERRMLEKLGIPLPANTQPGQPGQAPVADPNQAQPDGGDM